MRLPGAQRALLGKLLRIAQRLYDETDGFLDHPGDVQLWYNRGYANGVVDTLIELGYAELVEQQLRPDPGDARAGIEVMTWGQAYRHGLEVGSRDTREVIGPAPGRR